MLMEWLEPAIKVSIDETLIEIEIAFHEHHERLSHIVKEIVITNEQQTEKIMELEEIFNNILCSSIEMSYRRGFKDCFKNNITAS